MARSGAKQTENERWRNRRHLSIQSEHNFIFANRSLPFHSQINIDPSEMMLIGAVADLLEDIRKLVYSISKTEKSEKESVVLLTSLLSTYYPLIGLNYNDVISLFIYETICIDYRILDMQPQEIRTWWPK